MAEKTYFDGIMESTHALRGLYTSYAYEFDYALERKDDMGMRHAMICLEALNKAITEIYELGIKEIKHARV